MRNSVLLLLVLAAVACGGSPAASGEEPVSEKAVIARREIPANTLVLYENMGMGDPDRTGNWRYYIRTDGCVFNTRNTQLFITDSAQFKTDDPTLFWNVPFGTQPDRCLTPTQQTELQEAINGAHVSGLKAYYPAAEQRSSRTVERWSLMLGEQIYSIIVEDGATPPEIVALKATISALIAKAPRSR